MKDIFVSVLKELYIKKQLLNIDGNEIPDIVQCFNSGADTDTFQKRLSSAFKTDRKEYNHLVKVIKNQTF